MERDVERPILDVQRFIRRFADPGCDGVSVARPKDERFEDEDVERALE